MDVEDTRSKALFVVIAGLVGGWKRVKVQRRRCNPVTAFVAPALAVGLALSGCGNSTTATSPTSSPASSSKPAPTDNTTLLLNPADIVLPGQTFTTAKPPQGFPTGAAVAYVNGDQSLVIDDRITLAPDSDTAAKGFEAAKAKVANALPNTTMTDVAVGQGGAMGAAQWKNGTKLANTITFHEGRANVTMEFDSPANAPFPEGFPVAIAQKQDAAIKTGLAG